MSDYVFTNRPNARAIRLATADPQSTGLRVTPEVDTLCSAVLAGVKCDQQAVRESVGTWEHQRWTLCASHAELSDWLHSRH